MVATALPALNYILTSEDASWTKTGQQLTLCAVVQLVLMAAASPVRQAVSNSQAKNGWLDRFLHARVGVGAQSPKDPEFVATLYSLQLCASLTVVVLWILKTYVHEVTAGVFAGEMMCAVFIAFHYAVNMCKFSGSNVWSADAVLDVLTVVPLLVQTTLIKTWISLSFLRAVRAFRAFARLESSGALDDISDFTRAVILALLKFFSLLICFAGVMYVVEVLGDFDSFYDNFVETAMGAVSFYQMVYFVMVTVSTVGYGDYSPVTVLGRLFIIVFIISGVAFFSIETGNLMTIIALTNSGKGRYHPRKKGARHVVVAGGAIAQPSGQVIIAFLREICHASRDDCPEVVLLGLRPPCDELAAEIKSTPKLREHVKYICGSPLRKDDLIRVRANKATMLYVLSDTSAENEDKEDEENIMRGSMLYKLLPQVNLRLMLLRPENRQVAADIGLPVYYCFSVNEIKSNMMATSCRVQGFGTMALNLTRQDNNMAILVKAKMENVLIPEWQEAFMDGSSHEIYGFCMSSTFSGSTFQEAAVSCFETCGITLLAAQIAETGIILLSPGAHVLGEDDVCFAIAKDANQIEPVRHAEHEWEALFKSRRGSGTSDRVRGGRNSLTPGDLMSMVRVDDEVEAAEQARDVASWEDGEAKSASKKDPKAPSSQSKKTLIFPGGLMRLGSDGKHIQVGPTASAINDSAHIQAGPTASALDDSAHIEAGLLEDDDDNPVIDAKAEREDAKRLSEVVEGGGHVIVVGISKGLFQQIFSIIKTLRKPWLIKVRSIVCITGERAPVKLRAIFPDVCFVTGVAQKLSTLIHAGAHRAHDVVVLAGPPSTPDVLLLDRRVIILSSIIDSHKDSWGFDMRKVLELHSPASCNQLMNYSVRKAIEPRASSFTRKKAAPGSDFGQDVSPEVHPLFATGETVFRQDFCQLWASSFYTPGILEIVESLLCAGSASPQQISFIWLVDVPADFFGGDFKDFFNAVAKEGAICMGLLRPKMTMGAPKSFVHTAPPAAVKVVGGDQAYILGPPTCSLITSHTH